MVTTWLDREKSHSLSAQVDCHPGDGSDRRQVTEACDNRKWLSRAAPAVVTRERNLSIDPAPEPQGLADQSRAVLLAVFRRAWPTDDLA